MTPIKQQPHPNAAVVQRLGEIALHHPRPWEFFEWFDGGGWFPCHDMDVLMRHINQAGCVRERMFNPITIDGEELEGPLTDEPEMESEYWLLLDDYPLTPHYWEGMEIERQWLAEGTVFRTKQARDDVQTAIVRMLTGGD